MSRSKTIGLVVLFVIIFLVIVIMRACRTDYEPPATNTGPVSYAVMTAHLPIVSTG